MDSEALTQRLGKVRKATIEALRELVSDPELLGTYLEVFFSSLETMDSLTFRSSLCLSQ